MNVILLDPELKSSLACVRSLTTHDIKVCAISNKKSLVASSRYISKLHINVNDIDFNCKSEKKVLMPTSDISMVECYNDYTNDSRFIFPFGDFDQYNLLSNKVSLFKLAQELNVLIPKTIYSDDIDSLEDIKSSRQFYFPIVIKPSQSRIYTENGWSGTKVKYANSPLELSSVVNEYPFNNFPFLLQERIQGPGIGIFLLTLHGKTMAFFAHKRIREKPPSGGVSVVCESIEPPKEALESAKRLFEFVGWTGVGMVEFKMDKKDQQPKLMEVNARFWGSLQLAISAGVDFPYLLYKMAIGEDCSGPESYRIGIRSRWELGDLDYLLIRLKNNAKSLSLPEDAPSVRNVVYDFCKDFFRPSVKNEIFRFNDPKPFIYELLKYIKDLKSS